jgi:hypothetical protein
MDIAAAKLDRAMNKYNNWPPSPISEEYFSEDKIVKRITKWFKDPKVINQIARTTEKYLWKLIKEGKN